MKRVTEAYKQQHFRKIIEYGDRLKNDETLVKLILQEHLSYVPKRKLYKYRECKEQSFAALAEQNIWMSMADDFRDVFDYIINFDLKKNNKEIREWLYNNITQFIFAFIKIIAEKKGVPLDVTIEQVDEMRDIYFFAKEHQIDKQIDDYLHKYYTEEQFPQAIDSLNFMRKQISDEKIDELAKNLKDVVYKECTATRKKALIYCMTEQFDNRSLWENYASDYSGFCIEYDFSHACEMRFDDYKNLIYLMPMHYLKKKPYFDIVPFLDGAAKQSIFHDENYKHDIDLQIRLNEQLLMKNNDYSSEKEWRFSIKNEGLNLQHFPFVSGIYVGHKISTDNLEELSKVADKLNVKLFIQTVNKAGTDFEYIGGR